MTSLTTPALDPLFQASFHASPIGQYLLAPTERLEILAVNDAFLRSVSRQRADVLGRPLFDVFPNDPDDPRDTGVQDLARSIRTAIATGTTQTMPAQRYPIEMHRDGHSLFEDMYWSATNTPVYRPDGSLLCVSHTTIDITAQVKAEQALKASKEDLATVLRVAPVGMLVVDRSGGVIERNPEHAALFGDDVSTHRERVDPREWQGWFIDGPDAGRALALADWPLQRALQGETVSQVPIRVKSFYSETVRTMLVSSAPMRGPAGEVTGAVAVSMDIEARIRAEQALQEADRRKDEFLAMLAHELRNPLAPIGTAATLIMRSHRDDEQLQRTSKVIARQVAHMSGLVDELLDVARVTRGLITLDRTVLDAKRILADALEQARPAIEARGHDLWVNQPPRPAFVLGDHKRLVQVLANLLNNAAKFTPEGGFIQVDLAIGQENVRMSVTDNGPGMSPELIARAFELFAQGERTLDRSQGGLGIGLALVRSIVSLHGGQVDAQSDGPGQGTRFTVSLPKLQRDAIPAQEDQDRPAAPDAAVPLSILSVDDNEDALMMLKMLLGAQGHRVTATSIPREALRLADAEQPDVCVLDIGLPEIDGFALARALRANPRTRAARLIALSGYGQDEDRRQAFDAGFDAYLVKPVDVDALSAALSRPAP